ncbi:MAG: SHOCT domain-containing protein, partial [Verrucomicrobiales bacterium]
MSITTDLEKLASLRDQGDLSQAEFEKAKERLLSEDAIEGSQIREEDAPPLPKKGGE